MANSISTPVLLGLAAAGYYFFVYKPQQLLTSVTATNSSELTPTAPAASTIYPYLVSGAPLPLPAAFNQAYYLQYVYPAMLTVNSNVGSHDYVLSENDAAQYMANYVDIQQWLASFTSGTQYQHLNYHWQTYGVPEKRTFLPLWSVNPQSWTPPAPAKNSSGIFSDVLKGVTVVGAGVAIVASGGSLTSVVAPAASLALNAESSIHGTTDVPALGDNEAQILFTGAAVMIDVLPFYNQVDKKAVKAISAKLNSLLNQYS